ncbi:MAG: NfeD family protein [Desulfuromonadaceae bacterium]|jgi:membrane protein implicated in regulation of membrane protease activity|nr:NfeD family protein [Desulfuromonadaceae bacterium]
MEWRVLYWHWLVLGMILMIAEIFIPSFTIFWFGLGGIVAAAVLWLAPDLSLSWQLLVWVAASSVFAFLWFRFVKPLMTDRTKAGISREAIVGECGMVVKAPENGRRGILRFTIPILGSDEWSFICGELVSVGERVRVRDISGNDLIVDKIGQGK